LLHTRARTHTHTHTEGLKANLRRAYNQFNEEILESCAKQAEFRSIIFALCYFHAALLERKKFGEWDASSWVCVYVCMF